MTISGGVKRQTLLQNKMGNPHKFKACRGFATMQYRNHKRNHYNMYAYRQVKLKYNAPLQTFPWQAFHIHRYTQFQL
jgi:hypothetical protein